MSHPIKPRAGPFSLCECPSLLSAAQAGDARAADQLARGLLNWALARLSGERPQDREEIAIAFAAHLSGCNFSLITQVAPARLEGYLHVSLRHHKVQYYRERQRLEAREIAYPDTLSGDDSRAGTPELARLATCDSDPESAALRHQLMAAVQAAVDQMSLMDRQVFRLHFSDGLAAPEVARLMGRPVGTVSRHIFGIRARLKKAVGQGWL